MRTLHESMDIHSVCVTNVSSSVVAAARDGKDERRFLAGTAIDAEEFVNQATVEPEHQRCHQGKRIVCALN
jgi:hypothetical protein